MSKIIESGNGTLLPDMNDQRAISRRKFLNRTALAAVVVAGVTACDKNDDNTMPEGIDLGSGDKGILNYAYALEQLEAAFYIQVLTSPYSGGSSAEMALLADIRNHEIAHREFFKNALGADAIQPLMVDFTSINFSSRDSVLTAAKAFEDLGVSAYNGAGKLISTPAYMTLAGKIVSVEARHAAYIRDLISNGSFADNTVIDSNGLDKSRTPAEVLTMANTYLSTKVSGNNLPTA